MKTIIDTFVAQLENFSADSGTKSNANFRLNFPNKRLTGYRLLCIVMLLMLICIL